ncbi:copper resistance CopC/CopD family protein [Nocardioides sambongensis]|uniref:copper resistance CopC/CopD family protein n=1 Tax=Nocardioides sambongensis TaxID=2589074 RepID=UPI0015E873ED|nr:copper resistance protein CopC [Nocardioides sambongensis]
MRTPVPALGRFALVALIALLGVIGAAAPASAHASLVSSDPAEGAVLEEAPAEVRFTFDEPVSLVPDGIAVFDAAGEDVDVDEASARDTELLVDLPDGLDDGTYVVAWRIVSADGHPVAGSLTFHIGAPSPNVVPPQLGDGDDDPWTAAVRAVVTAVNYLALFVAGGLMLLVGRAAADVRLRPEVRRRLAGLLRTCAAVAVLTALLLVPLAGAYQLGLGPDGLVDSGIWDVALIREDLVVLALQAVGLGALALAAQRVTAGRPPLAVELLTAAAVVSPALVGHTRAYEPITLLVLTDALHLLAGATWLGGLVGLTLVLGSMRGRARDAGVVLARFSVVAAGLLLVLAVTGTLLGWRILGSWSALVETTYGRLLLVKLAIACLVALVAAWNRFRLLPAVSVIGHDQQRHAVGRVRRAVGAEALLLVGVLGVTGFLVEKSPSGESEAPSAASTGVATGAADDYRVLAVLDDADGWQRRLSIQIQDQTGEPVDLYGAPTVAVSSGDLELGEIPVVPDGAGTYVADLVFPREGTWEVRVSVRIDEFTNPVTTLDVEVD